MTIVLARPFELSPALVAAVFAVIAAEESAGFDLDADDAETYANDGVMCAQCFRVASKDDAAAWEWFGVGCLSCDDLCADCGPLSESYIHGVICACTD